MNKVERRVAFEGLADFRDLGGYNTASGAAVRWGRVYRSDALHRMTAGDATQMRELGMASVIDLRAPDEVAHVGIGVIDDVGARYLNLPTRPAVLSAPSAAAEPESAAEHYFGYLSEGRECFGGVVEPQEVLDQIYTATQRDYPVGGWERST